MVYPVEYHPLVRSIYHVTCAYEHACVPEPLAAPLAKGGLSGAMASQDEPTFDPGSGRPNYHDFIVNVCHGKANIRGMVLQSPDRAVLQMINVCAVWRVSVSVS